VTKCISGSGQSNKRGAYFVAFILREKVSEAVPSPFFDQSIRTIIHDLIDQHHVIRTEF
jgi:hypothetical protein